MKKILLLYALIAGVTAFVGCSESNTADTVEIPKEVFDPEEAFSEIPHDSFTAVWLEGGMLDEESDRPVYEETYDFILTMEKAIIPYSVSGKVIQTCEYSPSEEQWSVERHVDEILQEMDLSTYQWVLEDSSNDYIETFVKTGPNTFAAGEQDNPSEPYFTVDLLSGGANLKDEEGRSTLPGGHWTARFHIESPSYPEFKGEGAIDLIGGTYGFGNSRWIIPLSDLKRVEKERNMTDEERIREEQEIFRQTFPSAASFERMDSELASECNRELSSLEFGNVGVDKAAVAKNSAGDTEGWVVQAYSEDSFGGDVIVSVAIETDGSIAGLEFLLLQDTAGLGLRASEDAFKNQFTGKSAESLTVTDSENAGNSEINAISGATITSNAVTNAVNAALYFVKHYTGK